MIANVMDTERVSFSQIGESNKILVDLHDNRSNMKLEFGGKELRLRLQTFGSEEEEIENSIRNADINELNKRLKEMNCPIVKRIETGCLIIDIESKISFYGDLKKEIVIILDLIFSHSGVYQLIKKKRIEELHMFCYFYYTDICYAPNDKITRVQVVNHTTLKMSELAVCDVDIYASYTLQKLAANDFTTETHEQVMLFISGEVVQPENLPLIDIHHVLATRIERCQTSESIQTSQVILNHVETRLSGIQISITTKHKIAYSHLLCKTGPIPEFLRSVLFTNFQEDEMKLVQLMRLCVIMTVPLDYDDKTKGVDFYLEAGSQLSEAIENETFPLIVSTLLGGRDGNLPQSVEQLKVRAVLEYTDDQSDEDSDQAIDISECPETEDIETQLSKRIEDSRREVNEGRLQRAKDIAHDVFNKLTENDSEDVNMFKNLLEIFEECADNFYALKCFSRMRIINKIELELDSPGHFILLSIAMQYWVRIVEGPYEFEKIMDMFLEMENMAFEFLEDDQYATAAVQLCRELQISYSHLYSIYKQGNVGKEKMEKIQARQRVVDLHVIKMFYRTEDYDTICSICRAIEKRHLLETETLIMWVQALQRLGKVDVALKKLETTSIIESSDEQTKQMVKRVHGELIMDQDANLKKKGDLDMDWLEDTNFRKPKQMQESAMKIWKQHKPKNRKNRPKRQEQKDCKQADRMSEQRPKMEFYEDSAKFKSWKDVPPYIPEPDEKTKKRRQKRPSESVPDLNVIECEKPDLAEIDSGQESDDEILQQEYQITISDPNYKHSKGGEDYSDEMHDTWFESASDEDYQSSAELVENGLELSVKCIETFKHHKPSFQYPPEENINTLGKKLQSNRDSYKKCIIEIDSAHKALCRNLDLADDIQEIFISGRSKCGKAFSEDEVIVEVLGQPKSAEKSPETNNFTKDTKVYGKVLGILKRNRYQDIRHPVLVCAKDEFLPFMMKPLCKTVPKIQICHRKCESKHQLDLYSFDRNNKCIEYSKTIQIDHVEQRAYCYLVAIIHWEDMYPLGVTLQVINIKDEIQSGIDILRLQFRVPGSFSTETIEEAKNIQRITQTGLHVNEIFTVDKGEIGEFGFNINRRDSDIIEIGIHVPDVASVIEHGGFIDLEARKRGIDYETGEKFNFSYFLPQGLRKKVGFVIEEERRALSLFFSFEKCGDDISINPNTEIKTTVVKTVRNFSMLEANSLMKNRNVSEDLGILGLLSEKLRKDRLSNAIFYEDVSTYFLDEDGACDYIQKGLFEILLYADSKVAEFLLQSYPECVPLRCQSKPSKNAVTQWIQYHDSRVDGTLMSLQGIEMNDEKYSVLRKIQKNENLIPVQVCAVEKIRKCCANVDDLKDVKKLLGADRIHPFQCLASEDWTSIQENAGYRCSSNKMEDLGHFDLRLSWYTPYSKPLSNYLGIVVQRLVHAVKDSRICPFKKSEIEKICMEISDKKRQARQFYRNCQMIIIGHKFKKHPVLLNGFLQKITESDIQACFPALTSLHKLSKSIPLNLMHTRQRPVLDNGAVTMKWQSRIYSQRFKTKSTPKDNVYLKLDPNLSVTFQSLVKWAKLLRALVKGEDDKIRKLAFELDSKVFKTNDTVNDVCSEVMEGNFANQTCTYSLSFKFGQLLKIQMSATPERGVLIPIPQLYDISPNVKFCLQHVRNPVEYFSHFAKNHSKNEYSSCENYVEVWSPIISMEIASQCAREPSITMCDVPIVFREHGGSFALRYSYLEKRDIEFTAQSVDLLPNDKNHLSSGLDFLCIRCPLNSNPRITSTSENDAICSKQSYWIGHARVADIQHKSLNKDVVRVHFVCHKSSPKIPEEMKNKRRECHLEVLQVFDVIRRTEMYIKRLETASSLAQAIAQRKRTPPLDPDYLDIVKKQKITVNELKIQCNNDQRKAVQNALHSSFSLIQGPPGTGKTFTGVALIKLFCSINQDLKDKKHVVFCGPSNKSVDLVTEYLIETYGSSLKVLRMYSSALECKEFPIPGKVFSPRQTNYVPNEGIQKVTLHHLIRDAGKPYAEKIKEFDRKFSRQSSIDYREIKKYKSYIASAIQEEVPNYDVILCTTAVATSARLLIATKNSIFQLLIDEAGMCTEPECLSVIIATNAKQIVLIGDHKQLRPVVLCQEAAELGLQKSLFERYAESTESVLTFLRDQYRMHPSLCRFPSKHFYGGMLKTIPSPKWEVIEPLHMWRDPKDPCVFCHIEGEEEYLSYSTDEGNEMSRYNMAEVDQVVKVFRHLVKKEGVDYADINIMSQYNAQCSKIRLALKKQKLFVQNVNTVVASQGGEWDYVIFSLVRSLPEYRIEPKPTHGWCIENLGFITDIHQINVALTRARKGLIIIGNMKLMECDDLFGALLEDYRENRCVVDAENFPPLQRGKGHKK
ncbi:helicase with zinc finger domain 2-like isoform X2 [Saccostrea echinata]|uniref:helicase with zinc finger domain 2-like isoform X2 n=1 Tax=Saccostrea echinata TaxID=191078 RepID=UPI002A80AE4B|nr:helicase with zinc finger domain 2-like isoform X2 [Saccostrea echinata]